MEHPEERYYKLNRFLLSVTGLWPYQNEWSARFARTIITVIMLSCIFVQLSSIRMSDVNMDFLIELLPMIMASTGSLIQLYTRIVYVDKFKELFEHMWNDWALAKTDFEIKIMQQHAKTARLLSIYYSVTMYIIIIGCVVWLFIPNIFNVILPISAYESRLQTQFHVEFYIDKERYLYLSQFVMCIILFLLPLSYLASSSSYLIFTQHVCGMCELLGYRAERLFYVIEDRAKRDLVRGTKISCENIAFLVRQHYNVIKFVNTIESCYTISFTIDLGGIVICNTLLLLQILTVFENTDRALISIGQMTLIFYQLFIPNYMGQKITDMTSSICEKVYNSSWYDADVSEQKSLLLIMGRRFHPVVLTACKFSLMSLPHFGMMLQVTLSYLMFMRHIYLMK